MPLSPRARTLRLSGLAVVLAFGLGFGAAADAQSPDAPDAARGQRLFLLCGACHAVSAGAPDKVGPNLHGLFGRKVASLAGFHYSTALKALDFTWSDETLDAWLVKPSAVASGTIMAFAGLPKPEDRKALVAYLKTATQ